ncbi:glycosyltransferase [Cryobacterium melibiosiphilum]|uniref:Glycosyltransferase n=1 Tax=Cryobacterium melibiosiphilum TaxID=995039 RepID=A0A3A5MIQ6_9MICO|nr:glycosyltransferase family 4 protein [Cryobacterium melibiosiphilum]RJT87809.1 glycosyltransferase [Cryobacterium melibiosiphilum]
MADLRVAIAYDCLFPVNTGGGERVYRRLAELLAARGGAVDYVTRGQWSGLAPASAFQIVPVWTGDIYDATGSRTTGSALAFAVALFRHFRARRGEHDLVVVSALPVLNVFAVSLALLGTKTFIVTDWLEVWGWRTWRAYSGAAVGTVAFVLQYLAIRIGDLHTVNSDFTADRVRRFRRSARPVTLGLVDLVGTETEATTARSGDPYVIFVGRHIADKRLVDLLPALVVARRTLPQLHAVLVGSGPETDAVTARVSEVGLGETVSLPGRVSDERLRSLLGGAAVLVNPSQREGFGLVVAEAAAFATPSVVVAGPDNASAELVIDGVNGYVAASIAAETLGAAIVRAVSDGEELRARTRDWFARERVSSGLESSLNVILERYRSARAR